VGPLCVALFVLLGVEACTLPVRGTAARRARMAELRFPGALPPHERLQTRIMLMLAFAVTILVPLLVFLP
jgi:hypothetical protein